MAGGTIQGTIRFTGNQRIPQRKKVKYCYPIRIVFKGRWNISWFKHSQRVVPLHNQPNLFLILRVIHVFAIHVMDAFSDILDHCYWWANIYLITWSVGGNIVEYCWGNSVNDRASALIPQTLTTIFCKNILEKLCKLRKSCKHKGNINVIYN